MIAKLPAPPPGKRGWPWTEETDPKIYGHQKNWPKISIITPSYQQGDFLEETLRSVLLQNYPCLEYIVVDGGSTDETVFILKKYAHWLTYWVSEPDNGQSHAINKGLVRCSGEIFNWLNSDDYYEKGGLKIIADHFADESVGVVAAKYRLFDQRGKWSTQTLGTVLGKTLAVSFASSLNNQPSTFFRLRDINKLGTIDERLQYVMDQDLWIRYLLEFGQDGIRVVDDLITHFRVHDASKTDQHGTDAFYVEQYAIFAAIARRIGLSRHDTVIRELKDNEPSATHTVDYPLTNSAIVRARAGLNTLLLLNALKIWRKRSPSYKKKIKNILSVVEQTHLDHNELAELRLLKRKLRFDLLNRILGKVKRVLHV